MRTESDLQHYFIKEVKRVGGLADKLESKSRRGWPDVCVISGGEVFFIEFKHPNGTGRVGAHQVRVMEDISSRGGNTLVLSNKKAADDFISGLPLPNLNGQHPT